MRKNKIIIIVSLVAWKLENLFIIFVISHQVGKANISENIFKKSDVINIWY